MCDPRIWRRICRYRIDPSFWIWTKLTNSESFDRLHFSIWFTLSRSMPFHFYSTPHIARLTQTIKTSNSCCSTDLLISTYIYLYTHNKSKIYKRIYNKIYVKLRMFHLSNASNSAKKKIFLERKKEKVSKNAKQHFEISFRGF